MYDRFHREKIPQARVSRAFAVLLLLALMLGLAGFGQKAGWEKRIREETFRLEGLEKEYTLLFLTDMHMVVRDAEASEQEAAYAEERYAMFRNREGVSAAEQFREWVRYANQKRVDAVILGGDIIDSPSAANLQWLGQQLAGLKMPCLYVNGNHDWTYPWEYMTESGRENYLPLLEPFMRGNTAVQRLDLGEFLVAGIDNSANQVDEGGLAGYEQILSEGRPVIVAAHVPFLGSSLLEKAGEVWKSPVVIGGGAWGGIYPNPASERFVSMTTAADSPVELLLSGHVHFYDRDVIQGEKEVPQLTGGAGYEGNAVLLHLRGE